jgi:hypothetical protein
MGGYVFSFYLLLLLWHKQQFRVGKLKADFELREVSMSLKMEQAEITDDGGYFSIPAIVGDTFCSRQHNLEGYEL